MPTLVDVPSDLLPVQEVLVHALRRVEERVAACVRSDIPPVHRLTRHVAGYHGKMIRPAMVVLAGLAVTPGADERGSAAVSEAHVDLAAVCEMIHIATLVHDDVLDEAEERRRGRTVNSLAGNEAAVILGDYLFSAAYHLCSGLGDRQTAQEIARTGMTLCSGELLQLHHRGDFSLDEETYFQIVREKTASLIATAAKLGARHAGATPEVVQAMDRFGMSLGVAFQIQDDLLDLTGDRRTVGKTVHKDVEKGKLTLPLIHHLAGAGADTRGRTLLLLAETGADEERRAAALRGALEATGSIDHARGVAAALVAEARGALGVLPESRARRLLLMMADAVVNRSF